MKTENNSTMASSPDLEKVLHGIDGNDFDSDSDSESHYLSFDDMDDEELDNTKARLVLEAAGLVVNQDVKPPPRPKRRPAPPAPPHGQSKHKSLPPVQGPETEHDREVEKVDHEASLDDAFARYESFRNTQSNLNRLSVVSTDSGTSHTSPTSTISSTMAPTHSNSTEGSGRYSHFLHFLKSGNKTPEGERKSVANLSISAPIMNLSASNQSTLQDVPSRPNSPLFGMVRRLSGPAYLSIFLRPLFSSSQVLV